MTPTELLTAVAISLLFGVMLAPLISRFVLRVGLVDKPNGRHKLHGQVVPLAGGPLVIATTFLTLAALYVLYADETITRNIQATPVSVPGFLLAVLFMFGVGVIDDRFRIRGRVKLLGQIVAVSIAVAAGVRFESITLWDFNIPCGSSLGTLLTVIWLLFVVNGVSMLDGMDGMVGSIGLVIATTLAVMATLLGHHIEAVVAACLAGSLAAFLLFNKPPPRIFLGDSGSMTVGLLLGSLAAVSCLKAQTALILSPTLMLGPAVTLLLLPLLDIGAAITRRVLTGRSIFSIDRDHLHHRLLRSGLSQKATLFLVGMMSSVLSLGAIASLRSGNDSLAFTAAITVAGFLVVSQLFGVRELGLVRNKLKEFIDSFFSPHSDHEAVVVRLQGSGKDWKTVWQHLSETERRQIADWLRRLVELEEQSLPWPGTNVKIVVSHEVIDEEVKSDLPRVDSFNPRGLLLAIECWERGSESGPLPNSSTVY